MAATQLVVVGAGPGGYAAAFLAADPELAWCGLTEAQAKREGRQVELARFPWAASGRAITLDRTDGLTKLMLDAVDGRVLGVGSSGLAPAS